MGRARPAFLGIFISSPRDRKCPCTFPAGGMPPEHTLTTWDTLWLSHRPPVPGDLQLSEILPVSHPVVDAEFVEWANVSEDTLSWGSCLPPGTLCAKLPATSTLRLLMPDSLPGLWQTVPDLALTTKGTVTLTTFGEHPPPRRTANVDMTVARHPRGAGLNTTPLCVSQEGWCGGQVWTCPGEAGMSRVVNDWEWNEVAHTTAPSWGVGRIRVMTVPQGSAWGLWMPEHWAPPTPWKPCGIAGCSWPRHLKVLRLRHGRAPDRTKPVIPFPLPFGADLLRTLPTWNEVLLEPRDGFGTFVEWTTSPSADWILDYAWSSDPWAQPGDFAHVSDVKWWLPAASTVCLSACPTWVESNEEGCIAAEVPSLHGERTLSLRTPAGFMNSTSCARRKCLGGAADSGPCPNPSHTPLTSAAPKLASRVRSMEVPQG